MVSSSQSHSDTLSLLAYHLAVSPFKYPSLLVSGLHGEFISLLPLLRADTLRSQNLPSQSVHQWLFSYWITCCNNLLINNTILFIVILIYLSFLNVLHSITFRLKMVCKLLLSVIIDILYYWPTFSGCLFVFDSDETHSRSASRSDWHTVRRGLSPSAGSLNPYHCVSICQQKRRLSLGSEGIIIIIITPA